MSGLSARAEAHENHTTLPNAVLDMIEAAVRTAMDNDLEAPLRARLKRLLPDPEPKADLFGSAPQPSHSVPELELQVLSTELGRCEKLKMSGTSHATVRRLKAWVDGLLSVSKQARKA